MPKKPYNTKYNLCFKYIYYLKKNKNLISARFEPYTSSSAVQRLTICAMEVVRRCHQHRIFQGASIQYGVILDYGSLVDERLDI